MGIGQAYSEAIRKPDGTVPVSPETARVSGCKMLARLRRNPQLWDAILAAAELDDYALAKHMNRMLRARRTEFYKGEVCGEVEDNAIQMRATELLADLLGHRKNAVELSGAVDFGAAVAGIASRIAERRQAEQAEEPAPDEQTEDGAGGDGS